MGFNQINSTVSDEQKLEFAEDKLSLFVFQGKYKSFTKELIPSMVINNDQFSERFKQGIKAYKDAFDNRQIPDLPPDDVIVTSYFQIAVQADGTFHHFAHNYFWTIWKAKTKSFAESGLLENGDCVFLSQHILDLNRLKSSLGREISIESAIKAEPRVIAFQFKHEQPRHQPDTLSEPELIKTPDVDTQLTKGEEDDLKQVDKGHPGNSKTASWQKKLLYSAAVLIVFALLIYISYPFIFKDQSSENSEYAEVDSTELLEDVVDSTAAIKEDLPTTAIDNTKLFEQVDRILVDIDIKVTQGQYTEASNLIEECKSFLDNPDLRNQAEVQKRQNQLSHFESIIQPVNNEDEL